MSPWSAQLGLICLPLIAACGKSGGTATTGDAAPGLPPNPILSTFGNAFAGGRPDAETAPMPAFLRRPVAQD